jgi:large subunit ribosomal protein L13
LYFCSPKIRGFTLSSIVIFKNQIEVNTLSYKTISANKETVNKEWVLVDAEGATLGRLATLVASTLRGKHKTNFTPHVDCGDNVVIINAEKVTLSGNKWSLKEYVRHTGYPGGQRFTTAEEMLKKNPIGLVENAVRGMLPKSRLGRAIYKNMHVYTGTSHPHEAQKPKKLEL